MGLSVSPSIFQRIMSDILRKELGKGVIVYLDDILLYSVNVMDHLSLLKRVLQAISKAGILLNPQKCKLCVTKLNYLGYTITHEGYRPQEDKVKAIREFPQPTTKKALKRFIGMMGFYSELIPNIQYVMGPLHEISGSKSEFLWNEAQEEAFQRSKELLVNSSTLAIPSNDDNAELILSTDASSNGYGASLTEKLHGVERPIGFTSGSFRKSQLNWTISEKEAFAFVQGLNFFYTYLYGRAFTFRTDNRSLSYLKSSDFSRNPSGAPNYKRLRWMEFISQFSFTVELRPGTSPEMQTADCLSRSFETGAVNSLISTKDFSVPKPFWIKYRLTMDEFSSRQREDMKLQNLSGNWKNISAKRWIPLDTDGVRYMARKTG